MNIILQRETSQNNITFGLLTIQGIFHCFTLEDKIRDFSTEEKVYGETAIPAGIYKVIISHSQRFNRQLPLLLDVPYFTGIRIHPGNTIADTLGCILVGLEREADKIMESRKAFNILFQILQEASNNKEPITIHIKNP